MAARKTPGTSLPPAVLGRMIARLRSHSTHSWWRSPGYKRAYTDADIMAAFKIDKVKFDQALEAYKLDPALHGGRIWTRDSMERAFNSFVHKHKRWPRWRDSRNWRETGLPYPRSMDRCWGDWRRENGLSVLIDNYCRKFPNRVTPQMVFGIPNVTTRRDIIVRLGVDNLTQFGEVLQQDDFGKMWLFPFRDGDDLNMMYVEVVNKTPQMKDGEVVLDKDGNPVFDHYFLRVPPSIWVAKNAVAWASNLSTSTFAGFEAES